MMTMAPLERFDDDYILYPKRWIVLAAFSTVSLVNNWIWITWSPIAAEIAIFWSVPVADVDAISAVYMYLYLPFCFVSMYLIVDVLGLSRGLWLGSAINALGAIIRLCGRKSFGWVYAGHFLCSAAQTFTMSVPPMLAAKWFGDHERATATAIGVLCNQFGSALGLGSTILINFFHSNGTVNDLVLEQYLAFQAFLALAGFLALVVFLRTDEPPTPPNLAEATRQEQENQKKILPVHELDENYPVTESTSLQQSTAPNPQSADTNHDPSFQESLRICITKGWAFAIVFGLTVGDFYSIPTFISQFVPTWTPSAVGWLGLAYQTTGVMGSFITGRVVDRFHNQNVMIRLLLLGAVLSWGLFFLFRGYAATQPWLVFVAFMGTGFGLASSSALGYEIGASVTYPANEATMGAVMQFLAQLFSFGSVTIGGWIGAGNPYILVCWGCIIVALGILLSISTDSKRPSSDTARA